MIERKPLFINTQFVLDLPLNASYASKQELRKKIVSHVGIVSYIITKKSNYVIHCDIGDLETSYKCQLARKYGIPVVSELFVDACLAAGELVDPGLFILTTKQHTNNFDKGKIAAFHNYPTKPKSYKSAISLKLTKCWKYKDAFGPCFHEHPHDVAKAMILKGQTKSIGQEFCVLEIHVSNSTDSDSPFCVFVHHGIIAVSVERDFGSKQCRYAESSEDAVSLYVQLFQQFTSAPSSLVICRKLLHPCLGSDQFHLVHDYWILVPTVLDGEVASLVDHIWVEAVGELNEILSVKLERLNQEQVEEAEGVLLQVRAAQEISDTEKVLELGKDFYRLIPHKQQIPLTTRRQLVEKHNLCQLIRDVLGASETTGTSSSAQVEAQYRALRCHIHNLEASSQEYRDINKMLLSSQGSLNITVKNIFRVHRNLEDSTYTHGVGNKKLLFHATDVRNFVGILSRGLMPPKLVVSEQGVERTDVGMLGSGIYFADAASTAVKYSFASKCRGLRLMAVNEVALGRSYSVYNVKTEMCKPPPGYDSVHGVARLPGVESDFMDDEFVVYSPNQQRLRYLVEFHLPKDNVKVEISCVKTVCPEFDSAEIQTTAETTAIEIKDLIDLEDPASKLATGLQSSANVQLPMKAVHVRAHLLDLAAKVVVLQEYMNDSNMAIEAKYVFPLDDAAAICGFEAFINGRRYVGMVKEKEIAHQEYKEAISKGHGAYLMDQETPEVFTVSVGNLPPEAHVLIKISYVTELMLEGELINFVIPGCVAPWLKEKAMDLTIQEMVETVKVTDTEMLETSVEVSVEMPFDIRTITSPTHRINVKKTAAKATVHAVGLGGQKVSLSHGFQLQLGLSEIHVPRMWVEESNETDTTACMLTFYPEFEAESKDVEIIIALDASNSMKGDAFINAQRLALLFLHNLQLDCKFNVVAFGTVFEEAFCGTKPQSLDTIHNAQQFIQNCTPSLGNTELGRMLRSLYLLPPPVGVTRNLVVISDGNINNADVVLRTAREHYLQLRLFTCGLGDYANKHLLRGLAQQSAGAFEYFDTKMKSKWANKVKSQLSKCWEPVLSNVDVEWQQFNDGDPKPVQAPMHLLSVFNGSRLVVYGFVKNCTLAILKARIQGQELSTTVSTTELGKTSGKMLHCLTARAIIRDWETGALDWDRTQHESLKKNLQSYIIDLSKLHSIICSLTSFIAVEERQDGRPNVIANIDGPTIKELIEQETVDELHYFSYEDDDVSKMGESPERSIEDLSDDLGELESSDDERLTDEQLSESRLQSKKRSPTSFFAEIWDTGISEQSEASEDLNENVVECSGMNYHFDESDRRGAYPSKLVKGRQSIAKGGSSLQEDDSPPRIPALRHRTIQAPVVDSTDDIMSSFPEILEQTSIEFMDIDDAISNATSLLMDDYPSEQITRGKEPLAPSPAYGLNLAPAKAIGDPSPKAMSSAYRSKQMKSTKSIMTRPGVPVKRSFEAASSMLSSFVQTKMGEMPVCLDSVPTTELPPAPMQFGLQLQSAPTPFGFKPPPAPMLYGFTPPPAPMPSGSKPPPAPMPLGLTTQRVHMLFGSQSLQLRTLCDFTPPPAPFESRGFSSPVKQQGGGGGPGAGFFAVDHQRTFQDQMCSGPASDFTFRSTSPPLKSFSYSSGEVGASASTEMVFGGNQPPMFSLHASHLNCLTPQIEDSICVLSAGIDADSVHQSLPPVSNFRQAKMGNLLGHTRGSVKSLNFLSAKPEQERSHSLAYLKKKKKITSGRKAYAPEEPYEPDCELSQVTEILRSSSDAKDKVRLQTLSMGGGLPFFSTLLKSLSTAEFIPKFIKSACKKGSLLQEEDLRRIAEQCRQDLATDANDSDASSNDYDNMKSKYELQDELGFWFLCPDKDNTFVELIKQLDSKGLKSLGESVRHKIICLVMTMVIIITVLDNKMFVRSLNLDSFMSILSSGKMIDDIVQQQMEKLSTRKKPQIFSIARGLMYIVHINNRFPLMYRTLELGESWESAVIQMAKDMKFFDEMDSSSSEDSV